MTLDTPFRALSAAAVTSLLLTACNGGGSAPGSGTPASSSYDPYGPVSITSSSVTGTSASVNGMAPISPGVNGGKFTVNFSTAGSGTGWNYGGYVYLNTTGTYSSNDLLIGWSCGKQTITDNCHPDVALSCVFDNANKVTCDTEPAVNLTSFLSSGIPKNAYVVVHVFDALGTMTADAAIPVQFQ